MRTAITTAITHDGKEILLAGRSVHLLEQKELVKKIRHSEGGARFHKEYALLSYQENDGPEQIHRFMTPALHETREKEKLADKSAVASSPRPLGGEGQGEETPWKPGDPLRTNGPTITEYVLAGYDPKNYPPIGYATRSTPEEIATAIAEYALESEGDELALGEAAKSEGLRKDLLGKSRGDLMKLAAEIKATLPFLKTKTAIVDAILATGYKGETK